MRGLAAQHILAPHSISCPMTQVLRGLVLGGGLGGELPRRPAWPDITSHLSQMTVLLCICVEATTRET